MKVIIIPNIIINQNFIDMKGNEIEGGEIEQLYLDERLFASVLQLAEQYHFPLGLREISIHL